MRLSKSTSCGLMSDLDNSLTGILMSSLSCDIHKSLPMAVLNFECISFSHWTWSSFETCWILTPFCRWLPSWLQKDLANYLWAFEETPLWFVLISWPWWSDPRTQRNCRVWGSPHAWDWTSESLEWMPELLELLLTLWGHRRKPWPWGLRWPLRIHTCESAWIWLHLGKIETFENLIQMNLPWSRWISETI